MLISFQYFNTILKFLEFQYDTIIAVSFQYIWGVGNVIGKGGLIYQESEVDPGREPMGVYCY